MSMRVDFRAIADPSVDPGIPGGCELIALAHTTTLADPDISLVEVVADAIGPQAAVTAIEVAAAFAMVNRVVEATGAPIAPQMLERSRPLLEQMGSTDFPGAGRVPDSRSDALYRVAKIARGFGIKRHRR